MAETKPVFSFDIPKIETHLLHDPVAEFVPEQDPEGDLVVELPGGLNRVVMPSPRGGFYTTKVEADLTTQAEQSLMRRGENSAIQAPSPRAPVKKDELDQQFDILIEAKKNRTGSLVAERHIIKDKIDGLSPRISDTGGHTPRRNRAYDALISPRVRR
eukprot:c52782_g1_i1.p1 GENE.c52782_g1_i1~~c52782_g1_i1.p1  ORF type:complete len:158 (-),score=33.32 c52782_g1_i1:106-579(-)